MLDFIKNLVRMIKSTRISFYSRNLNKDRIINFYFIVNNSQNDIRLFIILCIFGKFMKITWDYSIDRLKNEIHKPYIVYWKMIGKRYWE